MFKKLLPFIIVVLLLFWAIRSLFMQGFFPIHDNEQIGRLYELDQALKAFHIPPRISQNLGFGYGYPFFNFYPSFVYYVAEIFVLFGFSYIASTKIMIALGFMLAAIFMYLFSSKFFGTFGGIVSAVFYSYAPYHAVDAYVRGALPEFWTFVWMPLLFLCYSLLSEAKRRKIFIMLLCILNAVFILTHNLVAMMSSIFLGPFIVYLIFSSKNKKQFFQDVVITVIGGLSLSAFFWLPSYFEKKYTMIELLTKELADHKQTAKKQKQNRK